MKNLITILITVITLCCCWGCDKLDGEWKFEYLNNRLSCSDSCSCKSSENCVGPYFSGCTDCCIKIKEEMEETIKVERASERKRIKIEEEMEEAIKAEKASERKWIIIVVVLTLFFLILVAIFIYYIKKRKHLCFRPKSHREDFSNPTDSATDVENCLTLLTGPPPDNLVGAANICKEDQCKPQKETNENALKDSSLAI